MKLEHVEKLEASELAKARLRMILATLSGECTIPEACAQLGINESRFHKMRSDWLKESAAALEPGRRGRRPKEPCADAALRTELHERERQWEAELNLARVRVELAQTMPHLTSRTCAAKKKSAGRGQD